MDKKWLKERMYMWLVLIQTRPFTVLILLMVLLLTVLYNILPCFFTQFSIAIVVCVVLGKIRAVGVKRQTETSKQITIAQMSTQPEASSCSHGFNDNGHLASSWGHDWVKGFQRISHSSLAFVKNHLLSDIDEEGLMAESGLKRSDSTKPSRECDGKNSSSKQDLVAKCEFLQELGRPEGIHSTLSGSEEYIMCKHGRSIVANDESHLSSNSSHEEEDATEVPELEDCSTSSEEEVVCKTVLETMAATHDDEVLVDNMLQPTTPSIKAASACAYEDENSIDKHQILPPESCKHCNAYDNGFDLVDPFDKCGTSGSLHKLEITDAELQRAAGEFYTLEGDVLWSESDLKKQQDGKRLDYVSDDLPPISKHYELCKHGCEFSASSDDFSISPCKVRSGMEAIVSMPAKSKIVHYVDAKKAHKEAAGSKKSVRESAEIRLMEEMDEDVLIDQELRAIAFRSGNKGEDSNYMSTAGSFRDFVGSFRELEACWPEYGMVGKREEDIITGCCDDHARPCIAHSRSRSKVLQSDPLLSKASLIREQEIMDVLWQEYNEDMRVKWNDGGKQERESVQKQGLKTGAECSGSGNNNEVFDDGSAAEPNHVQADGYDMGLSSAPDYGNYDRNSTNNCRLGCDKACWHMAKARGYHNHRRRHFVGICRVLRELGLKQCIQSSKVDN